MQMTLESAHVAFILPVSTLTTPNGNSCASFVFQLCSRMKKLDLSRVIPSLRSYGKPIEPFRSNRLAPGSFGDPPRLRGVVGDDASS